MSYDREAAITDGWIVCGGGVEIYPADTSDLDPRIAHVLESEYEKLRAILSQSCSKSCQLTCRADTKNHEGRKIVLREIIEEHNSSA